MEHYVTIKLVTGEELIAEVTNQNDYSITVMNPFIVSTRIGASADGRMIEQQTATPYCSYAEDPMFTFDLKHIIFVKTLKQRVISPYLDMVHKLNMKEMMQDEINEYLDALEHILGRESEYDSPEATEEEVYENSIAYLEGNETVHQ